MHAQRFELCLLKVYYENLADVYNLTTVYVLLFQIIYYYYYY
jgi:hypothetical protein